MRLIASLFTALTIAAATPALAQDAAPAPAAAGTTTTAAPVPSATPAQPTGPVQKQLFVVTGRNPVPATTDTQNLWLLDLSTGGRVTIWLRPDVAPLAVARIKELTRRRFYDGLVFHRVIEGFMAQGGDPKGTGEGGSDLPDLKAEFNYLPHVRGAVSMARAASDDSANSQFYIVFSPTLKLDKKYTVFGRVIEGMQYVDAIERGEPPANPTRIVHAYIGSDNPPAYANMPAPAPVPAVTTPPAAAAPRTRTRTRR